MTMEIAKRFMNKVVLVTGAASGIGRASAIRFAEEGANVVIADRNLEKAKIAADEISDLGREALVVHVNVEDPEESRQMVAETLARFETLNAVFANAGIGGGDFVEKMDHQDWEKVIKINLGGIFLTCKCCIPALKKSKDSAIVTMASSMAGWDTSLQGAAYMASKEGVTGLTKSLALQLGGYGIRVNAVCPGVIKTNLSFRPGMDRKEWEARYDRFSKRIPIRRVGLPEDVAAAVAFLASDDARHISGAMLLIDGGQTLQSWSNAPDDEAFPLFTDPVK